MRLIITEKNNSAKKIAEILSGGEAKADATYKVPFYTWTDAGGEQMTVGLKGHVMSPAFPEGYSNWQETDLHDLIDAELIKEPTDKNVVKAVRKLAKDADAVVIATDYDREGELIGLEALEQILDVNPGVVGANGESERRSARRPAACQARPLLRAHQGGDRARLRRPRRPLLRPRLRGRRPPGHRPDLGRHAHPRRLARHPALRLQLPLRRPGPEPDPGADRRARARAPRPRREAVLGGVRPLPASRRVVRGPPRDRQVLGEGRGRCRARGDQEPRRGQGGQLQAQLAPAADPLQHHRLHHRRLEPARHHAVAGDADRRGPLHGRVHLLPADRQHGLSTVTQHPRAGHLAGPDPGLRGRGAAARRRPDGDPRQEGDDRPPADLPDAGASTRTRSTGPSAASTSSSCAASSPPSRRR